MKQLDQQNYSMNAEQFVNLAASLGTFFEQTGLRATASQASQDLRARGEILMRPHFTSSAVNLNLRGTPDVSNVFCFILLLGHPTNLYSKPPKPEACSEAV